MVAPPSQHPSGGRYSWSRTGTMRPTPVPPWLLALLRPPPPPPPQTNGSTKTKIADGSAYWQAAVQGELQRLRDARQGERRFEVCRTATRLGQLADVSGLGHEQAAKVVTAAILEVADALGWENRRMTERRIADAWELGLAKPRRLQ